MAVPPSEGPGELIRQILEASRADPARQGSGKPPRFPWQANRLREGGRQKLALAFALATALLIFALGWWVCLYQLPAPVPNPHSRYSAQREARLRKAHTARESVAALADFADDLLEQVCETKDQVRLAELTQDYNRLIPGDLLDQARRVPLEQRPAILSAVADRLRQTESKASRLAAEGGPGSESLRSIARAAREGDRQLRTLVEEGRG
jgi:hypothetical protein